jgi:hypothetical protein
MPDGTDEDSEFNDPDPQFIWPTGRSKEPMNDGCSLISLSAARDIWKNLGNSGMVPSVFQARINGAKGIWISTPPANPAKPDERWIRISKSQRKFLPHDSDVRMPSSADLLRWNFEVVNWSRKPSASALHIRMIPILVDRKVELGAIQALIVRVLDAGRADLLEATKNPPLMRRWLEKNGGFVDSTLLSSVGWPGGPLPRTIIAKAIMLLDAGFEPSQVPYLAQQVYEIAWRHFAQAIKSFSIPLETSTILLGIADPFGVLAPGEIHLAFSHGFEVGDTGDRYPYLHERDVLITRHPVLRPSDMQKVKTVYKMELSHIVDVVVFPSRGCRPLASMLQGGDYDGDMFWVSSTFTKQNHEYCVSPLV